MPNEDPIPSRTDRRPQRVIDQYRVSTDPRSGIVNDPNRPDDDHSILRLIGQVITVSLETQRIIATLPSLNLPT
jgi:predicted helicase